MECDAVPAPASVTSLQADDNCDNALTYTYEGETFEGGDCANSYTLFRHWSATDCSGNSSSWMQTLTVIDTQAPALDVTFADGSAAHDTTVSCLDEVPTLAASTEDVDGAPMLSATTDTLGLDRWATPPRIPLRVWSLRQPDHRRLHRDRPRRDRPVFLDVCGIENGTTTSAPKTTTATACCRPPS